MSYSSTKPVFIARKRYGTGLSGFLDALTVGLTGGAQVINAARGGSTVSQSVPGAPESSFPWVPVLIGAAVIGGVVIYKRRK